MTSCGPRRSCKGVQCFALCIDLRLAVPARCRPATAAVYPDRGRTALTTRAPSLFAGRCVPCPALPVRASGRKRTAAAPSSSKLASAALGSPCPLAASRSENAPSTTSAQAPRHRCVSRRCTRIISRTPRSADTPVPATQQLHCGFRAACLRDQEVRCVRRYACPSPAQYAAREDVADGWLGP